ncbi:TetR/AcrR family transcriptional regulator [Methylobacterium sp. ID0610]|uniref:TetR/AcrR family transcriptional regulator n=1 Tax=Methylobacterium carpenticola TaxID=3344827 RepID=UPI0036B2EB21
MRGTPQPPGPETAATSGASAASPRHRAPAQDRSARTVRRIEEAASRLLASGTLPSDLTTTRIAAEAELSVGALYRFFPDRSAVCAAVAARRLREFEAALVEELAPRVATANGPAFLARLIQAFVAFLDAHPDLRTLAYGGCGTGRTVLAADVLAGATVGLLKRYMVEVFGLPDTPDLDRRLRIVAEAGDRLIGVAFAQAREERGAIIDEMTRLLCAYLFG